MNIKDLMEAKGIIEEENKEKTKELTISRLKNKGIGDGKITIRNITDEEYDAIKRSCKTAEEINKEAVYRAVVEPDLRNQEFQDFYGCKYNPLDIVRTIFKPNEIDLISAEIGKLSDMNSNIPGIIEEVKNS